MENFGILCLIPPLVAVVLALKTKQTILSLFIAVWVGSTMLNGYNPIVGFIKIFSDFIIPSMASDWNAGLLVLVTLSGGLIAMLRVTGSAQAFAKLVTKKINNAKKGQIVTALSAFIFSYTEPCLMAELLAGGVTGNEWGIWLNMLPFNMYGLFAMVTVFVVAAFNLNIGPMHEEELRARKEGKLLPDGVEPLVPEKQSALPEGYMPKTRNFIIPLICLFAALFGVIMWTGDIATNGFVGTFRNANITLGIILGFVAGGIGAGVIGVVEKLFSPAQAFNHFVNGMAELISVPFILICAWSIGSITSQMEVGAFIAGIVESYLTPGIVPFMVFLFGALISFSTGSSWGVWSIMMPIAFPMAIAFDISFPYVVAAVIGGGLFGDQCSPISDTTVLSSTGASCNHVVHVKTQLPYGLTVGGCAAIGFLIGGLTGQYVLSVIVAAILLLVALVVMSKAADKKGAIA